MPNHTLNKDKTANLVQRFGVRENKRNINARNYTHQKIQVLIQ